jgi:magnesium transporter
MECYMSENCSLPSSEELQPADLANRLERMSADQARGIFAALSTTKRAAVLGELETHPAAELLESLPDDQVAACLRTVPRTVAADLVALLPKTRRAHILSDLPQEKAIAISTLLRYPPESTGGIMDNRFIAVRGSQTVDQCLAHLRETARKGLITFLMCTSSMTSRS